MKKIQALSLLAALCLLLQALALPSLAAQTTEGQTAPPETTAQQSTQTQSEEVPFGMASVLNGCRTIEGMSPLAGNDRKLDTAQAAFLYEITTQTVVYAYNPDMKLSPGSLAKLVNAAVVLEHSNLEDTVTLTSDINRRPADSRHSSLKTDEVLTVENLLYCMILQTANDAAIGLANHVAGNRQGFVTMMNQWVQSIGCTGTSFGSVHGLDSDSTTTARDMAKIILAAIQNEDLKTILGALDYELPETNKNSARGFRTLNYMIDKGTIEDFQDNRVTGGLASYASDYGASLVITMEADPEEDSADELKYVGVVLGCTRTFDPVDTWKAVSYGNFDDMTNLLKLGFNNYKINRILYDGMTLSQFTVSGGECSAVGQVRVDVDSVVPINANMNNLYMNYSIIDGGLAAPVEQGQVIATMQIKYLDSIMAEAEVYAMGSVDVAGSNGVTIHSTAEQTGVDGSGILSVIGTICVIVLGLTAAYLSFNSYMRSRMRARRRKRRADRRRIR